jgi:ribonuclease HIII
MRSISLQQKEVDNVIKKVDQSSLKRVPVTNQYELLRVKDEHIFFVVYTTGKMVFQESEAMDEFLDRILVRAESVVLGTDEAGKGEWYGPLVVAGVVLTPEHTLQVRKMGVGDSKDVSRPRLYEIGNFLRSAGIEKEVRVLSPDTYNDLYEQFKKEDKTLNDLLAWAHTSCISDILARLQPTRITVVVDEFDARKVSKRLHAEKFNIQLIQKTKGESEPAVAAASILAKVIFEEKVDQLNEKYGINLRGTPPGNVPKAVLPYVAKLHFKNVPSL